MKKEAKLKAIQKKDQLAMEARNEEIPEVKSKESFEMPNVNPQLQLI